MEGSFEHLWSLNAEREGGPESNADWELVANLHLCWSSSDYGFNMNRTREEIEGRREWFQEEEEVGERESNWFGQTALVKLSTQNLVSPQVHSENHILLRQVSLQQRNAIQFWCW
jgi:hypothetical protein